MKKYNFNPFNPYNEDSKNLSVEILNMKESYHLCDKYINDMRFEEDKTGSPVEIHLYVNLRKAIQDVITALDDIETFRRHLYGEN
jgi:hypothetical protein